MARPSTVIPRILAALTEFEAEGKMLPATNDGKVNVAGLCRELRNVRDDDVQHFHKKEEIKQVVNTMAQKQGLLPVGYRAQGDDANQELEQRIQQTSAQAREDAQAAVEATSAREAMLKEIRDLHEELARRDLEIAGLKERLRLIDDAGLFVRMKCIQ